MKRWSIVWVILTAALVTTACARSSATQTSKDVLRSAASQPPTAPSPLVGSTTEPEFFRQPMPTWLAPTSAPGGWQLGAIQLGTGAGDCGPCVNVSSQLRYEPIDEFDTNMITLTQTLPAVDSTERPPLQEATPRIFGSRTVQVAQITEQRASQSAMIFVEPRRGRAVSPGGDSIVIGDRPARIFRSTQQSPQSRVIEIVADRVVISIRAQNVDEPTLLAIAAGIRPVSDAVWGEVVASVDRAS